MVDIKSKIEQEKQLIEAKIISYLYSKPELFNDINYNISDFISKEWKILYAIGKKMTAEGKYDLSDEEVLIFVETKDILKQQFEKMRGQDLINDLTISEVNVVNFNSYLEHFNYLIAIIKLIDLGFNINLKLYDAFEKLKTADGVYNIITSLLNDSFSKIDFNVKAYDIFDGIEDMVAKADMGLNKGLPLEVAPILGKEINGLAKGQLYLFGGISGEGKTTLGIELIFPSILQQKEKLVVFMNEEGHEKFQQQLLVYIINSVLKGKFSKHRFNIGYFNNEEKFYLQQAIELIKQWQDEQYITLIPFERYQISKVIQLTKKYASLGVKYFMLDTLKLSTDIKQGDEWVSLMSDSLWIYDTIKESSLNVHFFATYQITKAHSRLKFLDKSSIGISKNIVDVASVNLMIRKLRVDEYPNERNELKIWNYVDNSYVPVVLDVDKKYVIIFIDKNRNGRDSIQLVAEIDYEFNTYKEVGYTLIPHD
jgi:replicative DNA helicase